MVFAGLFSCQNIIDPAPVNCESGTLNFTISSEPATDCATADGTISVSMFNETIEVQYSIDGVNFQNEPLFTGVASGYYEVLVRTVQGACENKNSVIVNNGSGLSITSVNFSDAGCGMTNGMIEVFAESTTLIQYNINGGVFSDSYSFTGLSSGNYTIGVKDESGCELYLDQSLNSGIVFADVKAIINASCAVSNCHVAGTGRTNYTIDANIVSHAAEIKTKTANGTMPSKSRQDLALTQEQIDIIGCWVDDGANLN